MKLRVYTNNNYLDLELKPTVDLDILIKQLDEGNTLYAELENGNSIILNTINIIAIEICPPIQK